MVKAVLLFLIVIAVLGMFGKWRLPKQLPRGPRRPAVEAARKCPVCGAYGVGEARAPCTRPDCPSPG
jgi:hypothetical protein